MLQIIAVTDEMLKQRPELQKNIIEKIDKEGKIKRFAVVPDTSSRTVCTLGVKRKEHREGGGKK